MFIFVATGDSLYSETLVPVVQSLAFLICALEFHNKGKVEFIINEGSWFALSMPLNHIAE